MNKILMTSFAVACVAALAGGAPTVAAAPQQTTAVALLSIDAAATMAVKRRTRAQTLRRKRMRLLRCRIVRERIRHPVNGRWIFVNKRVCPDNGVIAPRG